MATQMLRLPDGRTVHLGRIPPKRTRFNGGYFFVQRQDDSIETIVSLDAHYTAPAQPPPASADWTAKAIAAIKQMYGNDQWGDCVIADAMHQTGLWTGNETGTAAVGTTTEAVNTYHSWCGPGDRGCDISSVLKLTQSQGITVGGIKHKIAGYVAIDHTNQQLVMAAIAMFGTVKIGVNLPSAWENTSDGGIWDVTNTRIIGGHDIGAAGYGPNGVVIMTWAGTRTITWAAFMSSKYVSELYVPLSPDWTSNNNLSPSGFDVTTLNANMIALQNGTIPPFGPPPEVPLDWLI